MNKNKYLYALLPHRGLAAGKSRLSDALNDDARRELNRWLLARTLRMASEWLGESQRCVVVSPCVLTLALAREMGAIVVQEQAQGLNAALAQGAAHATTRGAHQLLILPCDLPCLDVAALQTMSALSKSGVDFVIAPDRRRAGTNAMLVNTSMREFAFGANSFARHVTLAQACGAHALTCSNPALAFDLDTAEDLEEWMRCGDALPPFLVPRALPA